MYFVYILRCGDGSLYTGITTDPERRLKEHRAGVGAHYTRAHRAEEIIHTEQAADRSSALRREAEIKRLSRTQKLALVGGILHS